MSILPENKNPRDMFAGSSHPCDQGISMHLGIHAAILFGHIFNWLKFNNRKSSRQSNLIDGKIWMYETQETIAECIGCLTIDEVKKATKILLDSGLLIKGNFNKNPFDRTSWYTIFDQNLITSNINSKKSYESAVRHDRKCDTALSNEPSGTIAHYNINNRIPIEKQRTSAVVFYECLKDLELSESDKKSLMSFPEKSVQHAVAFIKHPSIEIKTTLIQTLMWAAKELPKIPEEIDVEKNRQYSEDASECLRSPNWEISALSKRVEIISKCPTQSDAGLRTFDYDMPGFKDKFDECLKTLGFKKTKMPQEGGLL